MGISIFSFISNAKLFSKEFAVAYTATVNIKSPGIYILINMAFKKKQQTLFNVTDRVQPGFLIFLIE